MRTKKFRFDGSAGHALAAALDLPDGEVRATALLAHCFTCGKDSLGARHIAIELTAKGIAVLRFDFSGLGSSAGEFANSTFSSNVDDLVMAAGRLQEMGYGPSILIGHSLGGAAILAAAERIVTAKAIVAISAPSDPSYVKRLFADQLDEVGTDGDFEVSLAGRAFRIKKSFLDDISEQQLLPKVKALRKALLILHSPTDDTVGIENATRLFVAAKHPKSFISLDGADHLLSKSSDSAYVADIVAAWSSRYLPLAAESSESPKAEARQVVVRETGVNAFQQLVTTGPHAFVADEPVPAGGGDTGPGPYDLLLAALGACTAMTIRMYASRKAIPLDDVAVTLSHSRIHARDCAECETKEGMLDQIDRSIGITGRLAPEERARLMEIADKCPVHRTLKGEVRILTREEEAVRPPIEWGVRRDHIISP